MCEYINDALCRSIYNREIPFINAAESNLRRHSAYDRIITSSLSSILILFQI